LNPDNAPRPDCVVKPVRLLRLTRLDSNRACRTPHGTAYLVAMPAPPAGPTQPA
jgi:hypothetical protein